MPLTTSTYATNAPVTAKQLNTDLYNYQPGNFHTPNGIAFHSTRPLLVEGMTTGQNQASAPVSGAYTLMNYVGLGDWNNYFDGQALYAAGADLAGASANGQFNPTVPGSGGTAGAVGGWYLAIVWPSFGGTTNAGGSGASVSENGVNVAGGKQLSSTTRTNTPYALDLVPSSATTIVPMGYCSDASSNSFVQFSNSDYSGRLCRWYVVWAGNSGTPVTVSAVPTPQVVYTYSSAITATLLNGNSGIAGTLNFLNYPPAFRAANLLSTSIANSTTTGSLNLSSATSGTQYDNYSGFNGTTTYTVARTGVYLVHGMTNYSSNAAGGRQTAIQVNGTTYFGPHMSAAGSGGTAGQVTRLLDLQAGDTVTLATFQNSGAALALANNFPCRLILLWLGALSTAGVNNLTWTPPDLSFRWQAGTPQQLLPGLFQQHIANDLNFLINRPYFLGWQSVAQTGLATNVWTTIQMQTVGGRVHGSGSFSGDNYGGWTTGASNHYTAPVNGWYLAVGANFQATPATIPAHVTAGFLQSPAGLSTPDQFQSVRSVTTTGIPGGEAIGMYYLRAGDTLAPQAISQDGGTWATSVAGTGQESHFGIIWISE